MKPLLLSVFYIILKLDCLNTTRISSSTLILENLENEGGGHDLNRTRRHFSTHRILSDCGFRCLDGTCVKGHNKCDGVVHCGDASDEKGCYCKDRIGTKKICDGIEDCLGGEDEHGCGLGCQEDEFSCSTSKSAISTHCVKLTSKCDGFVDCFHTHRDESECFKLSTLDPNTRGVVSHGVLQKMIKNEWHIVCKSNSKTEEQLLKKYAKKTCEILVGHAIDDPQVSHLVITPGHNVKFTTFADKESKFNTTLQCSSGQVYFVTCSEPECGWPLKKFEVNYGTKREEGNTGEHKVYKRDYNVHGLTAKIVGGYDSEYGDWPFIVGLYRNGTFHCGGSLINKEWILTAAHCTHGFEKYVFEAQAGMIRRHSFSPKEQSRLISEIHVHEKYDSKIFMNDIALMKVNSPFYLSKWVTTACLATSSSQDPVEGEECRVIGWGDLAEDLGTGPDHLQEVKLPVLAKCLETFTKDSVQICAGVLEGGKDACQGDSGGPFICTDHEGRHFVNGLVSFGRGCARPDQAGVYTRVSAYTTWIENTMTSDSSKLKKHPKYCNQKCTRGGGECLFPKHLCDGHVDCLNADDELNCSYRSRTAFNDDADEAAYENIQNVPHAVDEHVHEYGSAKLCKTSEEFQCKTSLGCISLAYKCNGQFDCKDSTDEKHCECGDIIKNSRPEYHCDGFHHCLDGSDEADCKVCNGVHGQIKCPLSDLCINKTSWCDSVVDCAFGEDEIDCYRLMKTKGKLPESEGFLDDKISRGLQAGYVVYRDSGLSWQIACIQEFGSNMGATVCPYLGLAVSEKVLTRNARSSDWRGKRESNSDVVCHPVKVYCDGELICGQKKLYSMTSNTSTADMIGSYPWIAQILVEGEVVCPGTLIHKQWLLASSKCIEDNVRSTTTEYLSAITGFSKTSDVATSTMEQIKRINSVVKLADGLTLLRLENAFTVDHFTSTICPSTDKHIKNPHCVRVKLKNGTLYDTKMTYDETCEASGHHCLKFKGDKCKKSADYFVYCTEDLVSWFLLGYASVEKVSHCIHDGRLSLINPFHGSEGREMINVLNRPAAHIIKPPGCTGTRCSTGTCVGNKYVCDGISHCPDGLDERRCQRVYQRLLRTYDDDNDDVEYEQPNLNATIPCALGHFKCQVTGNCVPISAFCDGTYDCGYDDLSDEPDEQFCTCRNYLELASPESVCDPLGESRCPDRGDQLGCECTPHSFVCDTESQECVHPNMVCDSVKDCSNGSDEELCTAISKSLDKVEMDRDQDILDGYVLVRVRGSWHPYCSDQWSNEVAEKICQFLGYDLLQQFRDVLPETRYSSEEEGNSWNGRILLLKGAAHDTMDAGPLRDIVYEASAEEHSCTLGYITCSRF